MKKLRIENPDGVKILVLRDDSQVPRTYNDLMAVVLSKMPRMAEWARQAILILTYVDSDGHTMVHLDDDDDVIVMWEGGDTHVLRPEFEEATEASEHRLWPQERLQAQLEAIERRAVEAKLARAVARASESQTPPPSPPSLSEAPIDTWSVQTGQTGQLSHASHASHAQSVHAQSVRPSRRYTSSVHSSTFNPDILAGDVLTVKAGAGSWNFQLAWRSSNSESVVEMMGPIGKPEWKFQRDWAYKQTRASDNQMSLQYEPQVGSMQKMFSANTRFKFTIFFANAELYHAAKTRFPRSLSNLDVSSFALGLVQRLLPTATDWACIRPPPEYIDEHPQAGTEYQVAYIVKEFGEPLDVGCAERTYWWLKTNLIAGEWADEKAKKGFAW